MATSLARRRAQGSTRTLHLALTGLSLVVVLLSVNRLTGLTEGRLSPDGFLRWLDLNAMLPIPILGIVLYYLLKKDVERHGDAGGGRHLLALNLSFVVGIYLFGVSSGDHETTNYLNHRFCTDGTADEALCAVVSFHDDTFSHLLYYIGLTLYTLSVVAIELRHPRRVPIASRDRHLVLFNASLIALGIFANLAFEEAGLDIAAFLLVALLANAALWRAGRRWTGMPFTLYVAAAYGAGVVATVAYKILT